MGENEGVDGNYKCRVRKPWYKVPTSWKPEAFFYRQVGGFPRIVLNGKAAHTTDTLHKIRFNEGVDPNRLTVAFNNSLTYAMSELVGRSYGGGVLTFEPSEARSLPIPCDDVSALDIERADSLTRVGDVEGLLDYVDKAMLIDVLGMSKSDVSLLRDSWKTLRGRRLRRKRR